MTTQEELIKIYSQKSKHSNYQILPKVLEPILGGEHIEVKTRFERERLNYILKNVDIKNKSVLDIGGNTGYFSFEILDAGASNAHLYEGNKKHCEFVKIAAEAVGVHNLRITNDYYEFEEKYNDTYDVALLLNVLHHIGDDYGDKNLNIDKAKNEIIRQLNNMRFTTDILVFQLGFNWHGNSELGLFEHGSKREMIEFIRVGSANHWEIVTIGIAEKVGVKVVYNNLDDKNIERDNSLGEFLNRPIFILRKK